MKRCHYSGCQAGYVILPKAPVVRRHWNIDNKLVEPEPGTEATLLFHPGCWAAYQLENK